MKPFIGYFLVVIISLISQFSEGKSRASTAPGLYGWRFAPSTWRYHRSSGPIPPGVELSDLVPVQTSDTRAPIEVLMVPSPSERKRDTSYWNYGGSSSSSYYGGNSDCELTCDGGVCVKSEYRCDGYTQCFDGTDEKGCSCHEVIPSGRVCDGYKDCPDGMDEYDCVYGCKSNEFTCDTYNSGSKATCISASKRCDGQVDCGNGRDEHDCFRMVDLTEETRGVRSHGILQKLIDNEWHTVCKTASTAHYIKDFAEKACRHVSGYPDGPIKVKAVSLNNLKKQMSNAQSQDLRYVRLGEIETKFAVLGSCASDSVYDIQCPTPQCGGMGNDDQRQRRKRALKDSLFENIEEDEDVDLDLDMDEDLDEEGGELIVGGYETQEMQWPFLVGIFRDGEFYCGGSIINERWILTAAHCNHGYEKHTFEVQAGMTRRLSWSPYEQTRHVEEVYVHDSYDQKIFANDIALYKLDKPLYLSKYVTPACLPNGIEDDPRGGQHCKVAGWGDLKESGSGPDHMQEVALPVLDRCLESFTRDTHQICAGVLTGGKDACQGDSGGPLMCPTYEGRPVVNGVVSFGRGCARENEAGAYTRVSAYLDWIESVVSGEYSSSSYRPRPKQCSERCHKPGGECLYPEEKCSGKVECLGGEDEMGCANYITRSHAYDTGGGSPQYWSSYQRPNYYGNGMSRSSSASSSSPQGRGYQTYPVLKPFGMPMKGKLTPRNGVTGSRKTTTNCLDTEVKCATLDKNGLKECVSKQVLCDQEPNCADKSDEVNCIAVTDDFRRVVDSFSEMKGTNEIKGYVMGRYQGTDWQPIVLNEWTLELGQAVCSSVSPSSSLKSLETIQISELAQRLRSGVKLMEGKAIVADAAGPVMAMSSPSNINTNLQGAGSKGNLGLSKISLSDSAIINGDNLNDNFILGFVRCGTMQQ